MEGHVRQGWRSWGAVTAALLLAFVGPAASARTRSPHADRGPLDVALQRALDSARRDAPGAQATVVARGRPVWCGASGVTDLTSKRPVTPKTPFVIASTTKTVTATMIMQEVQAGNLSLGESLADFNLKLPKLSRADQQDITLEELLSNHSGLADYDIDQFGNEHHWKRSDILNQVHAKDPAGTYGYVNSNWVILGGILQKVSKQPVETFFRNKVAAKAKANMASTSTFVRKPAILNQLAHPYEKGNNGKLTTTWVKGFGLPTYYWGPVFTDGGLVSTATDLARFGNALLREKLIKSGPLRKMKKLELGLGLEPFHDHQWFGYSGSYGGYESENWTDPKRLVTITVTTNMALVSDGNRAGVAERIWKAVTKAYDNNENASSLHTSCQP